MPLLSEVRKPLYIHENVFFFFANYSFQLLFLDVSRFLVMVMLMFHGAVFVSMAFFL